MSLLNQLRDEIAGLEGDAKREFLRGLGVDAPEPAEPPKPPTALDRIRDIGVGALQELELVASEIPGAHEIAPVVGIVVKVIQELGERVDHLEAQSQHVDDVPPAQLSSVPPDQAPVTPGGDGGEPAVGSPSEAGSPSSGQPQAQPTGDQPSAPQSTPSVTDPAPNFVAPVADDAAPHTDQVRGAQE